MLPRKTLEKRNGALLHYGEGKNLTMATEVLFVQSGSHETDEGKQKDLWKQSKNKADCWDGDIWRQLLSSHLSALSQLGCPLLKKTKQKHTDILVYLHIYLQINHFAQQFCISSSTTSVVSWWWKQSGLPVPLYRPIQLQYSFDCCDLNDVALKLKQTKDLHTNRKQQ